MVLILQETLRFNGPDVVINCPACGKRGVPAVTYDEEIKESWFGLTVNRVSRSRVICSKCRRRLHSRIHAGALEGKSPEELADLVFHGASFYQKSLAVVALVLAILPFLGTATAVLAFVSNRKVAEWPKTASLVALALSIVPYGLFMIVLVLALFGILD